MHQLTDTRLRPVRELGKLRFTLLFTFIFPRDSRLPSRSFLALMVDVPHSSFASPTTHEVFSFVCVSVVYSLFTSHSTYASLSSSISPLSSLRVPHWNRTDTPAPLPHRRRLPHVPPHVLEQISHFSGPRTHRHQRQTAGCRSQRPRTPRRWPAMPKRQKPQRLSKR
jgi:hypothetical protein